MVDRPCHPGNAVESAAATTVVAKGGLWTLEFKQGSHRHIKSQGKLISFSKVSEK